MGVVKDYITTAELAELIGFSVGGLIAMRKRGEGPPYYRAGDKKRSPVRYRRSEVEAWLKKRRVMPSKN